MKDNNPMNNLIDLFFDPDYVKAMSQFNTADVDKLSDSELDKMIDLLFAAGQKQNKLFNCVGFYIRRIFI